MSKGIIIFVKSNVLIYIFKLPIDFSFLILQVQFLWKYFLYLNTLLVQVQKHVLFSNINENLYKFISLLWKEFEKQNIISF